MSHVNFAHLHVHTQYSLLDGACRIDRLIEKAVKMKFPAIAITDHGNMYGVIDFYLEAMKQGIKPIIGLESYVAPSTRFEKTLHGVDESSFHLVLLAKNETGYRNLMKLSSAGFLEGFYYKPRIDKEILKENSEGLVGISACLHGEIAYYLLNNRKEEARKAAREYAEIFGKEDFYIEIQDHGLKEQQRLNKLLPELAEEMGLKLVATNDVHYLEKAESEAHDALLCIQTGTTLDDTKRMRFSTDEFYLKSAEEMGKLFGWAPQSVKNTIEIAGKCNVELNLKKTHLPEFKPPEGKGKEPYLRELCAKGLAERLKGKEDRRKEYEERLEFELGVITKMRYVSYFLIVWDFIRYAKEADIPVGPGRGSAAGSLVAYSLGITDIDPIEEGLLFERFLNPDRVSLPDIDIDFCYERRDEVIDYVKRKYGRESVAQIITFGTMLARGVIRDVGRVMGMSYQDVDFIAKLIPAELNMTIQLALKMEPRLRDLVKKDAKVEKLIEVSQVLEGLTRHASTHAAGVVISNGPLVDYVPLFKANEQISTQYSMSALEKIGLLKMDFLGLKTLTVIDETVKLLRKTRGKDVDIRSISFKDKATYELLARGESGGVFQLESSGMREILRKMRPTEFGDIVALLALYRPGPLGSGMVDDFIRRKQDPRLIKYDHPDLEPILKETYGVILYQEQVMQIVSKLAGFSLAQADTLRRGIGKKIPEIMEREKHNFVEGAKRNNVTEDVAVKTWNLIEYFAGYGFNKSHSAAYSFISYQTAFLKANYTIEFMTALLTSEKNNTDKIVRYIDEAKRLGIQVLPPCVNESFANFTCHENSIRFGLSAVKNVGQSAIDSIVEARENLGGGFKTFYDYVENVDLRASNKKVIESLIKCGAFDCLGVKRAQLMAMLDKAIEMGNKVAKDRQRGQLSFLGTFEDQSEFKRDIQELPNIEEWPESQLLAFEKEMLGFYMTAHPLSKQERMLRLYSSVSTSTLGSRRDQEEVCIGGIISVMKEITTKKGDRMAFVTLEDLDGTCEVIVFPDLFRSSIEVLTKEEPVFIKGRVNLREDMPKIIASEVVRISQVREKLTKGFSITVDTTTLKKDSLMQFKELVKDHKGKIPVYLNFRDEKGRTTLVKPDASMKVNSGDEFLRGVEELFGVTSVRIKT